MSDQDWLSLGTIYQQYAANMFYRAMQYVNNKEDAEDVVSEAWLSLLGHFHKLVGMEEKALSTYIMRCVQNTAINYLRRNKETNEAIKKSLDDIPTLEHTPEDSLDDMLSHLLSSLSSRERQVVEFKIYGFNDWMIAQKMGIAASSVRVYPHRAHRRMRAEMQNIKSENDKG